MSPDTGDKVVFGVVFVSIVVALVLDIFGDDASRPMMAQCLPESTDEVATITIAADGSFDCSVYAHTGYGNAPYLVKEF